MRRPKKEGRYMGTAPLGYINRVTEAGKKYIAPGENEAAILKWAFQELASGRFNTEQIWKLAKERGLTRGSKHNFWIAVRNPLYCGKIFIPKFKDEESSLVPGQHEPLISESLFYDVQDILNGRKKIQRTKVIVDDMLPLRGFLICPKCGRMLTAPPKDVNNITHYYHCSSSCGTRYTAHMVNDYIVNEIKKYVRPLPKLQLYKEVLASTFKAKTGARRDELKRGKCSTRRS